MYMTAMPVTDVIQEGEVMIRKIVFYIAILLFALLQFQSFAQNRLKIAGIKYISREFVYIDRGASDGIRVGDTLQVQNVPGQFLVVRYIASHSSSCIFTGQITRLKPGMKVIFKPHVEITEKKETEKKEEVETVNEKKGSREPDKTNRSILRGSFRIAYYYWNDQNNTNLDFSQPSAYFNLKYIPGNMKNTSLNIKLRARRDYRSRSLNRTVSKSEWRNRVYQLYVSHESANGGVIIKAGRILENNLTGIGYLDGVILGYRTAGGHGFGVLGGTRPEWHYSEPQTSIQKYGIFYSKEHHKEGFSGTTSVSVNGEYHQSTVSREYVSMYHTSTIGSKMFLYLFSELDYNRDWRKEKSTSTIGMSNVYLSFQYNWKPWLRGGISLDQRKNYWTYEYYSIADSLFDQTARRGIRLNLSSTLPGQINVSLQTGLTKRETESQPTLSNNLSLTKSDLFHKRILLMVNTMYFHNPFLDGVHLSTQMSKPIMGRVSGRAGVKYYMYRNNQFSSQNMSVHVGFNVYLWKYFSISSMISYHSGDDENGIRSLIELGYYF